MSISTLKWETAPETSADAEQELALVEAELQSLAQKRRMLAELIFELESDRKYLRMFIYEQGQVAM